MRVQPGEGRWDEMRCKGERGAVLRRFSRDAKPGMQPSEASISAMQAGGGGGGAPPSLGGSVLPAASPGKKRFIGCR